MLIVFRPNDFRGVEALNSGNLDEFLIFRFVHFRYAAQKPQIKRLDRIGAAANARSVGDFSARAIDKSADEIGLLTKRLNTMAIRLIGKKIAL